MEFMSYQVSRIAQTPNLETIAAPSCLLDGMDRVKPIERVRKDVSDQVRDTYTKTRLR